MDTEINIVVGMIALCHKYSCFGSKLNTDLNPANGLFVLFIGNTLFCFRSERSNSGNSHLSQFHKEL